MQITITKIAYIDIEKIFQYSIETFGLVKAEEYKDKLFEKIIQISKMPTIGHKHQLLDEDFKIFKIEKHVVIYTIDDDQQIINIIRVVHEKTDFKSLP